jgi:hypothetical protein
MNLNRYPPDRYFYAGLALVMASLLVLGIVGGLA